MTLIFSNENRILFDAKITDQLLSLYYGNRFTPVLDLKNFYRKQKSCVSYKPSLSPRGVTFSEKKLLAPLQVQSFALLEDSYIPLKVRHVTFLPICMPKAVPCALANRRFASASPYFHRRGTGREGKLCARNAAFCKSKICVPVPAPFFPLLPPSSPLGGRDGTGRDGTGRSKGKGCAYKSSYKAQLCTYKRTGQKEGLSKSLIDRGGTLGVVKVFFLKSVPSKLCRALSRANLLTSTKLRFVRNFVFAKVARANLLTKLSFVLASASSLPVREAQPPSLPPAGCACKSSICKRMGKGEGTARYAQSNTIKIKIWSFAFGSSFLLISITSILKKQEKNSWLFPFFKTQMPGLYHISQESSLESFENITSKYINRIDFASKVVPQLALQAEQGFAARALFRSEPSSIEQSKERDAHTLKGYANLLTKRSFVLASAPHPLRGCACKSSICKRTGRGAQAVLLRKHRETKDGVKKAVNKAPNLIKNINFSRDKFDIDFSESWNQQQIQNFKAIFPKSDFNVLYPCARSATPMRMQIEDLQARPLCAKRKPLQLPRRGTRGREGGGVSATPKWFLNPFRSNFLTLSTKKLDFQETPSWLKKVHRRLYAHMRVEHVKRNQRREVQRVNTSRFCFSPGYEFSSLEKKLNKKKVVLNQPWYQLNARIAPKTFITKNYFKKVDFSEKKLLVPKLFCKKNEVSLSPLLGHGNESAEGGKKEIERVKQKKSTVFKIEEYKKRVNVENDSIPSKMSCSIEKNKKINKNFINFSSNILKDFFYKYGHFSIPDQLLEESTEKEEVQRAEEKEIKSLEEKEVQYAEEEEFLHDLSTSLNNLVQVNDLQHLVFSKPFRSSSCPCFPLSPLRDGKEKKASLLEKEKKEDFRSFASTKEGQEREGVYEPKGCELGFATPIFKSNLPTSLYRLSFSALNRNVHYGQRLTAAFLTQENKKTARVKKRYTILNRLPIDKISSLALDREKSINTRWMSGYQIPEIENLQLASKNTKKVPFKFVNQRALYNGFSVLRGFFKRQQEQLSFWQTYLFTSKGARKRPRKNLKKPEPFLPLNFVLQSKAKTKTSTETKLYLAHMNKAHIKVPLALPLYESKINNFFVGTTTYKAPLCACSAVPSPLTYKAELCKSKPLKGNTSTAKKGQKAVIKKTFASTKDWQRAASIADKTNYHVPVVNRQKYIEESEGIKKIGKEPLILNDSFKRFLSNNKNKKGNTLPVIKALKKMPYKKLSLKCSQEVKPLFEQVNQESRISPYRFSFKNSLFSDYNDYLSWQKDTPAAISISPSFEEDKAIEDSWNAHLEKENLIKEIERENLIKEQANNPSKSSSLKLQTDQEDLHGNSYTLFTEDVEADATDSQSSFSTSSLPQKGGASRTSNFLEEKAKSKVNKVLEETSPIVDEEEDEEEDKKEEEKKKEITTFEWLLFIRDTDALVEKRKGFQKVAYSNKEALFSKRLPKQKGKIQNRLVKDRKDSFFGITNLFPKRLIAQDQKQINDQILQEENDKRSKALFEQLQSKKDDADTQLSYFAQDDKERILVEQLLENGVLNKLQSNQLAPQAFLPSKDLKENSQKAGHFHKNALYANKIFISKEIAPRNRERSKVLLPQFEGTTRDPYSRASHSKDFTEIIKAKSFSCLSSRQHPIYTPNRRLRLRLPQSSLSSQNNDPESFMDDLDLTRSHKWWQKRRIPSSLLGAPSKRYLAMPELTAQDWRKIVEWQLKTYFLEEEKRIGSLVLEKGVHYPAKNFFKLKKIAIYLPWTTLKKSLNKPFEWPLTGLSYQSNYEFSQHFDGKRVNLQKNSFAVPCKSSICNPCRPHPLRVARSAWGSPCPCPVGARARARARASRGTSLQIEDLHAQPPYTLTPRICLPSKDSVLTRPIVKKESNFLQNRKNDSCFVSSISPQFKRSALSSLKGSLPSYSVQQNVAFDNNSRLLCNHSTCKNMQISITKKQLQKNSIYKPYLFEQVTEHSHLFLHQLLLAVTIKQFLYSIYKVFGKIIVNRIKNSSLAIALLPLFFNNDSRFNQVATFYALKKRFKDLAASEHTISSLSEIVWYLRNSCRGRMVPRGVVLVESVSSESTDFLKAIGGEAQVPVIVQSLRALPFTQNHPQRRLEKVLTLAQKKAPCILFLDDLDAIGQSRTLLLKNNLNDRNGSRRRALASASPTCKRDPFPMRMQIEDLHAQPMRFAQPVGDGDGGCACKSSYKAKLCTCKRVPLRGKGVGHEEGARMASLTKLTPSVKGKPSARHNAALLPSSSIKGARTKLRFVSPPLCFASQKVTSKGSKERQSKTRSPLFGQSSTYKAPLCTEKKKWKRFKNDLTNTFYIEGGSSLSKSVVQNERTSFNLNLKATLPQTNLLAFPTPFLCPCPVGAREGGGSRLQIEDLQPIPMRFAQPEGDGEALASTKLSFVRRFAPVPLCACKSKICMRNSRPLRVAHANLRFASASPYLPLRGTGRGRGKQGGAQGKQRDWASKLEKKPLFSSAINKKSANPILHRILLNNLLSKNLLYRFKLPQKNGKSPFSSRKRKSFATTASLCNIGDIFLNSEEGNFPNRKSSGEQPTNTSITNINLSKTEEIIEQRRVDLMLRLLTVMDGITHLNGVLIVTTSKNPSLLDPALLRPGRFERLINLHLPNKKRRIELLKVQTSKIGYTNPMPWEYFGTRTKNMTGTEIASAINHSAFRAIIQLTAHTVRTLEYGISCVNDERFTLYPFELSKALSTLPQSNVGNKIARSSLKIVSYVTPTKSKSLALRPPTCPFRAPTGQEGDGAPHPLRVAHANLRFASASPYLPVPVPLRGKGKGTGRGRAQIEDLHAQASLKHQEKPKPYSIQREMQLKELLGFSYAQQKFVTKKDLKSIYIHNPYKPFLRNEAFACSACYALPYTKRHFVNAFILFRRLGESGGRRGKRGHKLEASLFNKSIKKNEIKNNLTSRAKKEKPWNGLQIEDLQCACKYKAELCKKICARAPTCPYLPLLAPSPSPTGCAKRMGCACKYKAKLCKKICMRMGHGTARKVGGRNPFTSLPPFCPYLPLRGTARDVSEAQPPSCPFVNRRFASPFGGRAPHPRPLLALPPKGDAPTCPYGARQGHGRVAHENRKFASAWGREGKIQYQDFRKFLPFGQNNNPNYFFSLFNKSNRDFLWSRKIVETLRVSKLDLGNWYRLYLPRTEQNKNNREWLYPDKFFNQHISLLNINTFFLSYTKRSFVSAVPQTPLLTKRSFVSRCARKGNPFPSRASTGERGRGRSRKES